MLTIFESVSSILCAVSVGGGLAAAAVVFPSLLSSTCRVFLEGWGVDPGWSSASRALFFLNSWKLFGAPATHCNKKLKCYLKIHEADGL